MSISFKSIPVKPFKISSIKTKRYLLCFSSLSIKKLYISLYYQCITWSGALCTFVSLWCLIQTTVVSSDSFIHWEGLTVERPLASMLLFGLQLAVCACVLISGSLQHKEAVRRSSLTVHFLCRQGNLWGNEHRKALSGGCRCPNQFTVSAQVQFQDAVLPLVAAVYLGLGERASLQFSVGPSDPVSFQSKHCYSVDCCPNWVLGVGGGSFLLCQVS